MSETTSEATGRRYGIQRVCQAWERSRSALYARRTSEQKRQEGGEPSRRGPKPKVSDAKLLASERIHEDPRGSGFQRHASLNDRYPALSTRSLRGSTVPRSPASIKCNRIGMRTTA